jgi:hypothetical protein
MRKLILVLIILSSSSIIAAEDYLSTIRDNVRIDSLNKYVSELSGETPVMVRGNLVQFQHRNEYLNNDTSSWYLIDKMKSFGLPVRTVDSSFKSSYDGNYVNIIAEQTGTLYPDKYFIICAHYDCTSNEARSPGADDNGSGTAAVIEAARILSRYKTEYSIKYILFDAEELGLRGSQLYTSREQSDMVNMLGAINLDMIGYDWNSDMLANLCRRDVDNTIELSDRLMELSEIYNLGLNFQILEDCNAGSDQLSFQYIGRPSYLLIESFNEFNPCYHTSCDRVNIFSSEFFRSMAQAGILALADYSRVTTPIVSVASGDVKNYNISLTGSGLRFSANNNISSAKINIYNYMGELFISKMIDIRQSSEAFIDLDGQFNNNLIFIEVILDDSRFIEKVLID